MTSSAAAPASPLSGTTSSPLPSPPSASSAPPSPHPLAAHARALHHALAAAILPLAPARTTLLSASLLHHAAAGEVAAPLAGFLHTLTGRGDPLHTLPPLLDVGHTSGAGLAAGALAAAHALTATEQAP